MKYTFKLTPLFLILIFLSLCVTGCSAPEPEPIDTRTEQEKLFDSLDRELVLENGSYSGWLDDIYRYYFYLQMSEDYEESARRTFDEDWLPKAKLQIFGKREEFAQEYLEKAEDQLSDTIDALEQQARVGDYYIMTVSALTSVKAELEYKVNGYGSTTYYVQKYLETAGYDFPIETNVLNMPTAED